MHKHHCLLALILALCGQGALAPAQELMPAASLVFSSKPADGIKAHGNVKWGEPGPRPPEYPAFSKDSTSIHLDGKGSSYLSFNDQAGNKAFQFGPGEEMTVEAWVKADKLLAGSTGFIVSKGRTGQKEYPQDNLNWAMRVAEVNGQARLNFLFATYDEQGKTRWHRWTSDFGFVPSSGWHHLALSYRFGKPESLKGWIDGVSTAGQWDLDGATEDTPKADESEVWVGRSLRNEAKFSFNGWIHSVAVHRRLFDDAFAASRFDRTGGSRLAAPVSETMPAIADVPEGKVLMVASESMPSHERWLYHGDAAPKEIMRWTDDAFILSRLPQRYDDTGMRSDWKAPFLLNMAADVSLPVGKQKILMRVRGLARLWVDGKIVARGKPDVKRQVAVGGRNPLVIPQPPLPGHRPVQEYMQEIIVDADIPAPSSPGAPHRIVLEQVVGAPDLRTQSGETLVALLDQTGKLYHILQPSKPTGLPLKNSFVNLWVKNQEAFLTSFDEANRRRLAGSQDAFWNKRHELARSWAEKNPAPAVPAFSGEPALHPIDAFLQAKIDKAVKESAEGGKDGAGKFHKDILPVLQSQCFRCHGDKERGGLKLNTREASLLAGDSGTAAVVPGSPDKSELIARLVTDDESLKMPPKGEGPSPAQVKALEEWIRDGAAWPEAPSSQNEIKFAPLVSDEAFLRRVYFDLAGLPPSAKEIAEFVADTRPGKREQVIDKLLQDGREADHWMSFWQDLLAENPSLLATSMNSTGPFRWFLYESLLDRKPLDRMITELLQMRGSFSEGGSIGFGSAGENDAPFAEKGHIIASAFLGLELQCARCHDSPYHSTTQKDLFSLAAMMGRKTVTVPPTSSVPAAFFENNPRASLIKVTLRPNEGVPPKWPFADETGVSDSAGIDRLMMKADDSRERLAALITAPENTRFPKVMVNRLWKRLMGAGIVEPVHDWEGRDASHPELLDWLAHEFVAHGYDFHHILRLITTSQAYQREATGNNLVAQAKERYFQAPDRRRLTAEQIVDAMHAATGRSMDVEELTFDPYGRWPASQRMNLGQASRAWMMVDLKNERDRPSLSLPKARAVIDVLEAFGWVGARQKPVSEREEEVNVLQPGILANSVLTTTLTRAATGSALAELAVQAHQPGELVERLFLDILNRKPKPEELAAFTDALAEGFENRLVPPSKIIKPAPLPQLVRINWLNHAQPEANTIQEEYERRVRLGGTSDPRLEPAWRGKYEDLVWSLINHREFVWLP